jgi:adenylosuccinate synthase
MKRKKVYTVTDLGGGDGGKGGVVHKLATYANPHTIIKVGGAQGSHGVTRSTGEKFNFSQFGCGTFEGIRTHISNRFVASPVGILNEANELAYTHGIHNPLSLLTVDENTILATSFHGIASRLKELARKENARGIIGVGIGEASFDAELFPELTIFAKDVTSASLRDKLRAVFEHKRQEFALIHENEFLSDDLSEAKKELALLRDEGFFEWVCEIFKDFAEQVTIVPSDYMQREIFSRSGTVVIEGSHGVLTDRYYGFHPHTTRLRTVPSEMSEAVLKQGEWDGDVVRLGVTRAYQIRHGAGPLVVDSPTMAEQLLPYEVSPSDRYRGHVRVGPLDFVSLRYARDVCGGRNVFDAICMTWCDSVLRSREFTFCTSYEGANDQKYFTNDGEIRVHHGIGDEQLWHQSDLTKKLFLCRPRIQKVAIQSSEDVQRMCTVLQLAVEEQLGVPLRMVGIGPTENEKILI